MPASITRLHPWRPSRKAVEDFTGVCRQTGLDRYLRMDEPTGADIERLARETGQTEDWRPPEDGDQSTVSGKNKGRTP